MKLIFHLNETTRRLEVTLAGMRLSEAWGWRLMWALEPALEALGIEAGAGMTLEAVERRHIEKVLRSHPGVSYRKIANMLGIAEKTLSVKREKYNLEPPAPIGSEEAATPRNHRTNGVAA